MDRVATTRRQLLAGGAALLVAGPVAAAVAGAVPGRLNARALAARVADVRGVREIKRLQHMWGHLADAGQWQAMAALFTPEGVWTDGSVHAGGRAAIAAQFGQAMAAGAGRLNLRLLVSPVITLAADGQSGTGRWHEIALTGQAGVRGDWGGGIHVVDYALTGEGWRIARMHYHPQFMGSYAEGWRSVPTMTSAVPFHYTPDQAGVPVPLREAVALPAGQVLAEADQLLAASAAQNLCAAFGYYLDRKMYDDVVELFDGAAVIDVAGVGRFTGAVGVRRMLGRFGAPGLAEGELNERLQLMPVVTVDASGREAKVRSYVLGMTGQHKGATFWSATVHEFTMRQGSGGVWRIARLDAWPRMRAGYDKGWGEPLPAALAQVAGSMPDAPSALIGGAYPEAAAPVPAFAASLAPRPAFAGKGDGNAKVARALAYDGAENVCCAYGYYIDEFEWDGTADVFSTKGWKELSYIGTFIGRERIRESMVLRYGRNRRSTANMQFHQKTQPYATVSADGQRTSIRLRLWQFGSSPTAAGSWISGIYENQVIVEDGIFRIQGMDLDYVWLANYKGGWGGIAEGANRAFAPRPGAPDPYAKFPPDAPLRGNIFPPYPKITPMDFHYVNPVSGRKPEILLSWSDGRRTG